MTTGSTPSTSSTFPGTSRPCSRRCIPPRESRRSTTPASGFTSKTDGSFCKRRTNGYDIITGEPPPPHFAGVAGLYSREFFELVRQRLNPGGIVTYWLPVHDLKVAEAQAITRAFLDVFPDASLWSGAGFDWILMATKPPVRTVTSEQIRQVVVPCPIGRSVAGHRHRRSRDARRAVPGRRCSPARMGRGRAGVDGQLPEADQPRLSARRRRIRRPSSRSSTHPAL